MLYRVATICIACEAEGVLSWDWVMIYSRAWEPTFLTHRSFSLCFIFGKWYQREEPFYRQTNENIYNLKRNGVRIKWISDARVLFVPPTC